MVDVIGRAKVIVESSIDRSSIDQTGGKLGAGLKKGALIGVAALGTVAAASVSLYKDFEEAEKQSAKLANVLDNMGESKAVPAVEELADELRKLTGVDDEVIKGGQTILATFSEVAESAGETGGVFDRATRAALDLSATGFGSVESASTMLGKALQDPVKGITALSRAGVTFSEDQKNVIKSLVETGDVAKAQQLILKEVEKQVGGTAEASVTESEKISTAMGEIRETLGGFVADLIDRGDDVDSFSESLEKLNTELTEFGESDSWEAIQTGIDGIVWAVGKVIGAIDWFIVKHMEAGEGFGEFVDDLQDGWEAAKTQIGSDLRTIGNAIKNAPGNFLRSAGRAFRTLGGSLVDEFVDGFLLGGVPGRLAQRIRDAINDALPDTITFFGARGGVPAIRVPVPQFADGVRNFGGGLAMVGERGPEIVSLPAGSDVFSNQESQNMAGGAENVFNFYGPTSLSQARREGDWARRYGTRFGGATLAGAL